MQTWSLLLPPPCVRRAQKEKRRAQEYDKKREEKRRTRQLYHLRHSKVRLGLPLRARGGWLLEP